MSGAIEPHHYFLNDIRKWRKFGFSLCKTIEDRPEKEQLFWAACLLFSLMGIEVDLSPESKEREVLEEVLENNPHDLIEDAKTLLAITTANAREA